MKMRVSILSERAARSDQPLNHGGKIRAGIKVLTRTAEKNTAARQIYLAGVARRLKFSEIEKQIEAATSIKNPLYPRNTPYFNVCSTDFGMPELANMIVEKYGELRQGDTQKQLYRFPVVFHSGDLADVYPNSYRRFGGSPGYQSHYGDDGRRYCQYLPEVTKEMMAEQKARRIKRTPPRQWAVRGLCEPNACPEFLAGQCKFRGQLYFFIPGIPSTGLMFMETSSEYAAEAIYSDLDRIQDAFGFIPRSNPNKPGQPIFFITKIQEPRTYFDEEGEQRTGLQWVPKLQADIDLGALLTTGITPAIQARPAPVAWLAAPQGMPDARTLEPAATPASVSASQAQSAQEPSTPDESVAEQLQKQLDALGIIEGSDLFEAAAQYLDLKVGSGWEETDETMGKALEVLKTLTLVGPECANKLIAITINVEELGIDQNKFKRYCGLKHGKKYTGNAVILNAIIDELANLHDSGGEVAVAYINAQLSNLDPQALPKAA